MHPIVFRSAVLTATALIAVSAAAADADIRLDIRNHRFTPEELRVPAGRRLRLMVTNHDATAEEFESHDLKREKLIAPGASVPIHIGPLSPGRYIFVGEFNESTAQGAVVAE